MVAGYPKGSEWRKWDLHAHTPLDAEWINRPPLATDREKSLFAGQYVERAINAGLEVLAITDHNFCSSFDDLLIPYIQNIASERNLTVLPGFEVTVSDCGGTHVLVIFSEQSPLNTINEVVSQLFPPGMLRFQGRDVLPSTQNLEQLNGILKQSGLSYLIVFAHIDRENGALNHRGGDLRARLWKHDFVRIAQLGKPPSECTGRFIRSVIDCTNSHYSRDITYIVASDCRSIQPGADQERRTLGDCFTWIKADPTFEGLKQIIFEPKHRISFQTHRPEEKPPFLMIEQVRFIDSSGIFQPDSIPLNPNLVTIIGGKSTGKSILLSCIAHTIDPEQAKEATAIAKTNVYNFGSLDFEVKWSNGDTDRLSDNERRHPVTFLPQMYIHRLVERENLPSLSNLLLHFLRQNGAFETNYRKLLSERDAVMTELVTEISNFFSHLSLWRETVGKITELGDTSAIETELNRIAEKSEELRKASGFTDEQTEQYEKIRQDLVGANLRLGTARNVEESLKTVVAQMPSVIEDTLDRVENVVVEAADLHGLE